MKFLATLCDSCAADGEFRLATHSYELKGQNLHACDDCAEQILEIASRRPDLSAPLREPSFNEIKQNPQTDTDK